jgi:hypothetical protein
MKPCKDCPPQSTRPAPHPGPRCATHHRAVVKARKARAHASRVQSVYGLKPGEYEALYESQGGRCFICRLATGASRRLSVDHCHATGEVRALLCRPCNDLLGHVRDDIETLRRAAIVLRDHPAQEVLEKLRSQ